MHPGQGVTPEFVVEVNQENVAAARARLLRARRSAAWAGAIGCGLLTGIAVGFSIALHSLPLALFVIPGIFFGADAQRRFAAIRKLRAAWAATGIHPVAMRLSAGGLRCGTDGAPGSIFLPWPAVAGFHLQTAFNRQVLVLDLAPGVTAATPGVTGLDHPDVQRALRRKTLGVMGIRFAVNTLRPPLGEIDQALASFSGGRVRIHPMTFAASPLPASPMPPPAQP